MFRRQTIPSWPDFCHVLSCVYSNDLEEGTRTALWLHYVTSFLLNTHLPSSQSQCYMQCTFYLSVYGFSRNGERQTWTETGANLSRFRCGCLWAYGALIVWPLARRINDMTCIVRITHWRYDVFASIGRRSLLTFSLCPKSKFLVPWEYYRMT